MRLRASTLLLIIGLFAGADPVLASTVPQLIPYSGSLTGPNGHPLPTGDYTLTFRIYGHPTSTDVGPVWGPQVFDGETKRGHGDKVPVVKGFFNVILGPVDVHGNPIAKAFRSSDRFVEVALASDPPNLPRHQVLSTPFAFRSPGETPVGGIIMYSGRESELPKDWRVCRGQTVFDLSSPLNGKRLPDLRSLFVKGAASDTKVSIKEGSYSAYHHHSFNVRRNTSIKINSYDSDEYVTPVNELARLGLVREIRKTGGGTLRQLYAVKKTHEALGVDDHGKSHSHHFHYTGVATGATVDVTPRHINLHYIIRIK